MPNFLSQPKPDRTGRASTIYLVHPAHPHNTFSNHSSRTSLEENTSSLPRLASLLHWSLPSCNVLGHHSCRCSLNSSTLDPPCVCEMYRVHASHLLPPLPFPLPGAPSSLHGRILSSFKPQLRWSYDIETFTDTVLVTALL